MGKLGICVVHTKTQRIVMIKIIIEYPIQNFLSSFFSIENIPRKGREMTEGPKRRIRIEKIYSIIFLFVLIVKT